MIAENFQDNDLYTKMCAQKGISTSDNGAAAFSKTMSTIFNAICIDTSILEYITNNQSQKEFIKTIDLVCKSGAIICFLGNHSVKSDRHRLWSLKESIQKRNTNLFEWQFKRWYYVCLDEHVLYSESCNRFEEFLSYKMDLPHETAIDSLNIFKSSITNDIHDLISRWSQISVTDLISNTTLRTNHNTLQIDIDNLFNTSFQEKQLSNLKSEIIHKLNRCCSVFFSHSANHYILHVTTPLITKGDLFARFCNYFGIINHHVLKVGTAGDYGEDQFDFLNNVSSFSINTFSGSEQTCWPLSQLYHTKSAFTVLREICSTLCFYPALCLNNPQNAFYSKRLAQSEHDVISLHANLYSYYNHRLQYSFKLHGNDSNVFSCIDMQSGAIYINDYEYEMLKENTPHHSLFQIFDSAISTPQTKKPNLKFALRTDSGIILRGPLNYYFGLAFSNTQKTNINSNFFIKLIQNRVHFFKTCVHVLSHSKAESPNAPLTKKVLLGIMDSARDFFLLALNLYIQERASSHNHLYLFDENDQEIFSIFRLAVINAKYIYEGFFEKYSSCFIIEYQSFLQHKVIPISHKLESHIKTVESGIIHRACRVWREIDSFYENVIALESAFDNILCNCDIARKDIFCYGIAYGSIELPIILAMLLEFKNSARYNSFHPGILCLKNKYVDNHKAFCASHLSEKIISNTFNNNKSFHILADDNIVTGRTLHIAASLLLNNHIIPDKLIIVRTPALNRISQMYLPHHGAPDTDLFWTHIYGLSSLPPYTKLNPCPKSTSKSQNIYVDDLGVFDKTRSYVLDALYKNGLYSIDSEVNERRGAN